MAKNKEEEQAPLDYKREQRQEGWSPAITTAASGLLLASLGAVLGFMGWLGISSVTHNTNIAVLNDSDKATRVHIVTEEKRVDKIEIGLSRIDTEVRIHNQDTNRHK